MKCLRLKIVLMIGLVISVVAGCSFQTVASKNESANNQLTIDSSVMKTSSNNPAISPTPENQNEIIENIHKILRKERLSEKDYEKLQKLLALKPNLNVRDADDTSLLAGNMGGNLAIFKMLLEAGADPNYPSLLRGSVCNAERCLKPPMTIAFLDHNTEAMRLLIEHGADPNKGDDDEPYLIWAVSRDYRDTVKMLIAHKADTNYQTKIKQTPLFFIKNAETGAMLIAAGAAINHQDTDGQTPLTYAIVGDEPDMGYDSLKVIKFLIKNGADVNIKDRSGKTPLQLALENKQINKAIIRELQKAGAK